METSHHSTRHRGKRSTSKKKTEKNSKYTEPRIKILNKKKIHYRIMLTMASDFPKEVDFPYLKPETPFRSVVTTSFLQPRPAVEDCSCMDHGPTPEVSYRRYLRAKDTAIYNRIQAMRRAMTSCASSILDHQCPNEDAKMNTLHTVDYIKRGHAPGCYTTLKSANVCEVGTPIEPLRISLTNGHRDASLFPRNANLRHIVDKKHPLVFTQTPVTLKSWFSPYIPGRTEYEDTVSRLGLARMRNIRQYLEPLPSSRLKSGDPNC